MDLKTLPFFTLLAPLLLFFQQVRGFLFRVISCFWKCRHIPADFSETFYFALLKRGKRIHFDDYEINMLTMFSLKKKTSLPVLFKVYDFEIVLYRWLIPVVLRGAEMGMKIYYFKFSFPFDRFMNEVVALCHEEITERAKRRTQNRFYCEMRQGKSLKALSVNSDNNYSHGGSPSKESSPKVKIPVLYPASIFNRKMGGQIIGVNPHDYDWGHPADEKDKYQLTELGKNLLHQTQKWLQAERWYKERNIAWRRGFLLHGAPGNGKSALVLEIAKRLGIPLFIFDLSSMDNNELGTLLNGLPSDSAIILFEDFDVIFDGRENKCKSSQYGGVTFDFFLNKLSGTNSITNKLVFVTTNHLKKIDSALLRPGRMDEILKVLPLNMPEKINLAKIILNSHIELIDKVLSESETDTTAEFENRCTKVALATFWEGAPNKS
jgi:hypothetical protein